jgi:hypothetical protein
VGGSAAAIDIRKIAKEAAILFGIGAVPGLALAIYLALDHRFLGTYGDTQQLLWQARNLANLLRTGNAIVTDAFFGVPSPYAYMPTSFGEGTFILVFRTLTGSPWFTMNFGVLLGLAANLASMYVCLRVVGLSLKASLLGAFMYMMAPQSVGQALSGHMWFSWTFLFPPFLLLILHAGKKAPPRWWLWLGIIAGSLVWIHEYWAFFGGLVAFTIGSITFLRQERLSAQLVRPLIVLSFNSPKPTKGLDALTHLEEKSCYLVETSDRSSLWLQWDKSTGN